jgi:hypothetical protein
MEPIIYKFPKRENKPIELSPSNFIFDTEPSPKLLKYGFNQTIEKLNLAFITNNVHYKAGLNFDFDRTDNLSITNKCGKIFGLGKSSNCKLFFMYWEILNLFKMLDSKISVLVTDLSTLKEIEIAHQKIFKSKLKITFVKTNDATPANLIVQTYSQIDLDENSWVHLIINDLPFLLSKQSEGSNMILQLFGICTQITVEIIYYLSTLYEATYLIKPSINSSGLSDEKYLVCTGFLSKIKIKFPKITPNKYLSHIGIEPIPDSFINTIQCANSELIPYKIYTFNKIKTYLDSNIYEGIIYDEMIQKQNSNTDNWIELFTTNQKKLESLLEKLIKQTDEKCDYVKEWNNLF